MELGCNKLEYSTWKLNVNSLFKATAMKHWFQLKRIQLCPGLASLHHRISFWKLSKGLLGIAQNMAKSKQGTLLGWFCLHLDFSYMMVLSIPQCAMKKSWFCEAFPPPKKPEKIKADSGKVSPKFLLREELSLLNCSSYVPSTYGYHRTYDKAHTDRVWTSDMIVPLLFDFSKWITEVSQ